LHPLQRSPGGTSRRCCVGTAVKHAALALALAVVLLVALALPEAQLRDKERLAASWRVARPTHTVAAAWRIS